MLLRAWLRVGHALAVRLGHSEAKALEHLRSRSGGGVRTAAGRAGVRAFWFSVFQLYSFCAVLCALLRGVEATHGAVSLELRHVALRPSRAHSALGRAPVVVQLYDAGEEVRHDFGDEHCGHEGGQRAT
jgi:hypothetical protein